METNTLVRVLFTGSRDHQNPQFVIDTIKSFLKYYQVEELVFVHGDCPNRPVGIAKGMSVDQIAKRFANIYGIKEESHPANWNEFGKAAGFIRNQAMVDLGADMCLAFPFGKSNGTRHCAKQADKAGIEVRIYEA
jgi:hypothetical protein